MAAIKHDAHNFQMDHPGKDTDRLAEAGSDLVMISGPDRLALLESVREERTLDELVAMVSDRVDIVLTEGYRRAAKAKCPAATSAASLWPPRRASWRW